MIHVQQTKLYDAGPPVYRGNCYAACVASIFEIPIESLPDLHHRGDRGLNEWLAMFYPGVAVRSRDQEPLEEIPAAMPLPQGYWIATVESPRYTETCNYHVAEGGTPMPPYWYHKEECPHCGGSGTRPGFHAVVAKMRDIAHDPHPASEGYGWEYVGRFVGATWFEVADAARLVPRQLPRLEAVA